MNISIAQSKTKPDLSNKLEDSGIQIVNPEAIAFTIFTSENGQLTK